MEKKFLKSFLGILVMCTLVACSNKPAPSSVVPSSNDAPSSISEAPSSAEAGNSDSNVNSSSAAPSAAPSSQAPSSAAPSSAAPSSAAPSSSAQPASSSEAPSSSAAPSSSVAPLDLTHFPISLVNQYFMGKIGMEVELPDIVLPNNMTFSISDGLMDGPQVACGIADKPTGRSYVQLFRDNGWFFTNLSGDNMSMNYLGCTEAYVYIMINNISMSFEFFTSNIPDEDPSLDPIELTANPFPGDQVITAVYAPNNIEVVMPEFASQNVTFSVANVVPGQKATVMAQNFPADEKTALLAAFVDAGWIANDAGQYIYNNGRAYFTVQEVGGGRMFMMNFAVREIPTTVTYTVTSLPTWIQDNDCVVFAWVWGPSDEGSWKSLAFGQDNSATFEVDAELTGFLLARCVAGTTQPDWDNVFSDDPGRIYNKTNDIICEAGVYSYAAGNDAWVSYNG